MSLLPQRVACFPSKGNEDGTKASSLHRCRGEDMSQRCDVSQHGQGPGFIAKSCMPLQCNCQAAEGFVAPSLHHRSYS